MSRSTVPAAVCLVLLAGTAAEAAAPRALTFEERVEAQTAIERVYWTHRVWPRENRSVRPDFAIAIPRAAIVAKVEKTLQASTALAQFWGRPLTPEQIQAELDRMARETTDPRLLSEIFAALHDDPVL